MPGSNWPAGTTSVKSFEKSRMMLQACPLDGGWQGWTVLVIRSSCTEVEPSVAWATYHSTSPVCRTLDQISLEAVFRSSVAPASMRSMLHGIPFGSWGPRCFRKQDRSLPLNRAMVNRSVPLNITVMLFGCTRHQARFWLSMHIGNGFMYDLFVPSVTAVSLNVVQNVPSIAGWSAEAAPTLFNPKQHNSADDEVPQKGHSRFGEAVVL